MAEPLLCLSTLTVKLGLYMFIVPVYVAKSNIAGLGLFARREILRGEKIWEFNEKLDIQFTPSEWEALQPTIRELLSEHSWQSYENGTIYYEATAGKYINHSDDPNTDFTTEGIGFASRAIQADEEITSDYREFMHDWSHLDFVPKEAKP